MNVSDAKICGHCNKMYDCMANRICPFCGYDIGIFVQKCIENSCENKLKEHNCELEKQILEARIHTQDLITFLEQKQEGYAIIPKGIKDQAWQILSDLSKNR